MVMSTRGSSVGESVTGVGFTTTTRVGSMKVIGLMLNMMGTEWRLGLRGADTRVSI